MAEAIISLVCSPTEMNVIVGRFRADFKLTALTTSELIQNAVEDVLADFGIEAQFQKCDCNDHCVQMQYVSGLAEAEHLSMLNEMKDALYEINDFSKSSEAPASYAPF